MPAPSSAPSAATPRLRTLDALRGFAIVLMVVDHVIVATQTVSSNPELLFEVRRSLTRLAMPLFMVVSGALWALHGAPSRRRLTQVFVAAVAVNVSLAVTWPEVGLPEILAVWVGCALAAKLFLEAPVEVAVLGLLFAWHYPLDWDGFQPGFVAAFVALGVLWARTGRTGFADPLAAHLPELFAAAGRRPLSIYVGHLVVLVSAVVVFR